nr:hypothetical protein CFP56_17776 [Quercus suber]
MNTLHTSVGEISISLWDLHLISGLPMYGSFYDEVVPPAKDMSSLPSSCCHIFVTFHHLSLELGVLHLFTSTAWVKFWFRGKGEPQAQDLDDGRRQINDNNLRGEMTCPLCLGQPHRKMSHTWEAHRSNVGPVALFSHLSDDQGEEMAELIGLRLSEGWRPSLEKTADGCKTKVVGTIRGRSSRTNDRKMKAVAKAVRMMCRRSFRTNGCEMKAVAKAMRRMCRWSSLTDGRKTKAVRRMRSRSSHTNGRKTKGSEMDTRMKHTNPESRDHKRTAIAQIRWTPRQEGQDAANRLELMLGSRRAYFYVLHKINQRVQQKKNNNKEDKKASILKIEKE